MRSAYLFLLCLLAFGLSAGVAEAQIFELGVVAGVPLTDTFQTTGGDRTGTFGRVFSDIDTYSAATKRLLIGPRIALKLPFRLQLQADALYGRINYNQTRSFGTPSSGVYSATTANAADRWQLATVVKRKFGPVFPFFVEAGAAWSFVASEHSIANGIDRPFTTLLGEIISPFTTTSNYLEELRRGSVAGLTVGGGWDLHLLFLHIDPEIRYTHWGAAQFRDIGSPADSCRLFCSNRDEVNFLLAVTF